MDKDFKSKLDELNTSILQAKKVLNDRRKELVSKSATDEINNEIDLIDYELSHFGENSDYNYMIKSVKDLGNKEISEVDKLELISDLENCFQTYELDFDIRNHNSTDELNAYLEKLYVGKYDAMVRLNKYLETSEVYQKALKGDEIVVADEEVDYFEEDMKKEEAKNAKKRKILYGILGVTGIAIIAGLAIKTHSRDAKLAANENASNENEIENEVLDKGAMYQALVDLGYDPYAASLMVENFSTDTIKVLMDKGFPIKAVEFYATESDFNLDYLSDYEDAREKFEFTAAEIVDYVNRAHLIDETNFYEEESIIQIVDILAAINNKEIISMDNINLNYSFHTSNNHIVDKYLFHLDELNEDDIKKLDALQHFAKEGTDLDKFLTKLAPLVQNVLRNPHDNAKKEMLYKYFNIFGRSLNGFTNEPGAMSDDKEFNEAAQLNGYFEYFFASQAFVEPYFAFTYPKELQNIDLIELEKIYYMFSYKQYGEEVMNKRMEEVLKHSEYVQYKEQILQYFKIHDLEDLIDTALLGPEFTELCQNGGKYKDIEKDVQSGRGYGYSSGTGSSSSSMTKKTNTTTNTTTNRSTTSTGSSSSTGATTTTTSGAGGNVTVTGSYGSTTTTYTDSGQCDEQVTQTPAGPETTTWNQGGDERTETTGAGDVTITWEQGGQSEITIETPAGEETITWDEVTEEVTETIIQEETPAIPPKPGDNYYWDPASNSWIQIIDAGEEEITWDDARLNTNDIMILTRRGGRC